MVDVALAEVHIHGNGKKQFNEGQDPTPRRVQENCRMQNGGLGGQKWRRSKSRLGEALGVDGYPAARWISPSGAVGSRWFRGFSLALTKMHPVKKK